MASSGVLDPQTHISIGDLSVNFVYPKDRSLVRIRKRILFIPYHTTEFDIDTVNASASRLVRQLMNITEGISHSQFIDDLQDEKDYIIKLYCVDELKNSKSTPSGATNIFSESIPCLTRRFFSPWVIATTR